MMTYVYKLRAPSKNPIHLPIFDVPVTWHYPPSSSNAPSS